MMSDLNKFTAGPWFVSGQMTKYVEARIGAGLIQEIAACGPTDADGGYGEQQHANARLVAAAPDLLEALEAILPFIPVTTASEGGAAKYSANVKAADMVRAAIAKARGQS